MERKKVIIHEKIALKRMLPFETFKSQCNKMRNKTTIAIIRITGIGNLKAISLRSSFMDLEGKNFDKNFMFLKITNKWLNSIYLA